MEAQQTCELESAIQTALATQGPVLVRIVVDYQKRPVRLLEAIKGRYTKELTAQQKMRFIARLGVRSLELQKVND